MHQAHFFFQVMKGMMKMKRLGQEPDVSNGTGWLNNLGANEVNEELQKMNDSLYEGGNEVENGDKDNKEVKGEEEEEEGTKTAEVDTETPEVTDQN